MSDAESRVRYGGALFIEGSKQNFRPGYVGEYCRFNTEEDRFHFV